MGINFGKILNVAMLVAPLVKKVEQQFKGADGATKREVVVNAVTEVLPIVEGVAGKDLTDDVKVREALESVIAAEKAVLNAVKAAEAARAAFEAVIADVKARHGR